MSSTHGTTASAHEAGVTSALIARIIRWIFPDASQRITVLGEGRTRLGRSSSCEVWLHGTEVSRVHAEIECGDGILLLDRQSKNGVFVNGIKVDRAELVSGDVLRVGEWVGIVEIGPQQDWPEFGEVADGLFAGAAMAACLQLARGAAPTQLPIVVQGATGTGKERVARAIHGWSGRSGDFVAVNCAALPEHLVEAELFGFRKGAFTGAQQDSAGLFRAAHGGTLLLDEVVDLPLGMQAKILRVLEEKEVLPLGSTRPVAIDVRVLAAAQRSLRDAVAAGAFRADLMARLDGLTLVLPELRERKAEITQLFRALLARHWPGEQPEFASDLIEKLALYDWPFNVRELDLVSRQLAALHGQQSRLAAKHLPEKLSRKGPGFPPPISLPTGGSFSSEADELQELRQRLRAHHGNVTRAAEALGISRGRAYRLLQSHPEIQLEQLRRGEPGPRE